MADLLIALTFAVLAVIIVRAANRRRHELQYDRAQLIIDVVNLVLFLLGILMYRFLPEDSFGRFKAIVALCFVMLLLNSENLQLTQRLRQQLNQ